MARRLMITCMKNEGPFILDWLAHHFAMGFDHALVFTNDCVDGTVELLDALADAGVVTRMDNPYLEMKGNFNPQHGALRFASKMPLVKQAEWLFISDVDEYVDIHVGDGSLDALFEATGNADAISMQWRLFGNNDVDLYEDRPLPEQFTSCAPTFCPRPVQAWAVKTLFRGLTSGDGLFGKIGVHRPFAPAEDRDIRWVTGSGVPVPPEFRDIGWRLGIRDHGYAMVTLNHYALRSAESFLVKRDRGRVNHVTRDQGLAYWLRMNFNMERNTSILRHGDKTRAKRAELEALPNVAKRHAESVGLHSKKIAELRARDDTAAFFQEITHSDRKLLSRHLNLLSRQDFDDGLADLPKELMERVKRVPVLN